MKIGSKLQFEVPDTCPVNCLYNGEQAYQGSLCSRCPVFNCEAPKTEEDKMYLPLIDPQGYRDDWAEVWEKFFDTGKEPVLYL